MSVHLIFVKDTKPLICIAEIGELVDKLKHMFDFIEDPA